MPSRALQLLRKTLALARPSSLALRAGSCPGCGPTLLVKISDDAISVRCIRCRASTIHMSIIEALRQLYPDLSAIAAYEMSSRGPLFEYLRSRSKLFTYSEFFDDVRPGDYLDGVQCQDVQALSYPDASFDLCTSTEVFEHVPDDRSGFREIRRVLRPRGRFVFTAPLTTSAITVERAKIQGGDVKHILEPEYHGDVIRGYGRVLCFRNYGKDILERLRECGFREARLVSTDRAGWWGFGTDVVVAER